MQNLYPVICTDDINASSAFYQELLGLKPVFQADWFVQLQAPSNPSVEIAFVEREHASVPEGYQNLPSGVFVTMECEDVDGIHERALAMGLPIVLSLRDEDWGQRHFITRDPTGLALDVVRNIAPSEEFAADYQHN